LNVSFPDVAPESGQTASHPIQPFAAAPMNDRFEKTEPLV
jgi:hypothetical protein